MKKRVLDLAQTSAHVYETIGPRRHQMTQKMSPLGQIFAQPKCNQKYQIFDCPWLSPRPKV